MMSDGVFEGISTRREKIGEILVDKFVTLFLVRFEAVSGTLPEFSDVVKQCGEV